MPILTLYFQLHQPYRLHPDRDKFLWDDLNQEVFAKVALKCYLPAITMFGELVDRHRGFKITLGMSGTFLEQAEEYAPEVVKALQRLFDAGNNGHRQVEYLDETYYHSLTSLFVDSEKMEFREQVSLHRNKLRSLFGVKPESFRNTELMYNNEIATAVSDMGYKAMLCEQRGDMFDGKDTPISPNAVFRAKGNNLLVIPRNRSLSDDVAFRFPHKRLKPDEYAANIARIDGEVVMLGYDFEHIGEHIWEDTGIFDFWRGLPAALEKHDVVVCANPTEVAERFVNVSCPIVDIPGLATSSWADATRDTFGWLGTYTQYELFKDIERLEKDAKQAGGALLTKWRHLTTSDNVYFLHERIGEDHAVHAYFNPYGGSITQAAHVLTRKIDTFEGNLKRFEILKRSERTAVIVIAPETGRLPDGMGDIAKYISGKSGGLGEVVTALCEGLIQRNLDVHFITLNLKGRFQRESHVGESQWREIRHKIDSGSIHLVTSSVFDNLLGAYDGEPNLNAAEFQKEIVNNVLKTVRAKSGGKVIVHSHDWMAGGVVAAYAKEHQIPVLHTIHNVFTGIVPIDMYFGVNMDRLSDLLYFVEENGNRCVDCQATAIKNATLINFVGKRFLDEVVNDYFMENHIIPESVRRETKEKYYNGSALSVINAPAMEMYPETCPHLVKNFGPEDNISEAKKENLIAFQKKCGLQENPDAILFFWPSRLDPIQKGIGLFEDIALKFAIEHSDIQFAIVADGVGTSRDHEEIMGRIAWASGGKIFFSRYDEKLSMLGFAAASDVFGVSLYEPCGQIDQIGNIFGATATNRDTGGYHDKIMELRLKTEGAPNDIGNGFLFRDYDTGGLWYGLEKSVTFHRYSTEVKEPQLKRIMKEARKRYDLNVMIAQYISIYERLNDGMPLS
ncbi:MAG: glycogen/starch synthase [Deltaproteobacteria bacterium]|nr:glycogen/starch synthase [Deltaproteobacteria bacterium]